MTQSLIGRVRDIDTDAHISEPPEGYGRTS